MQLHNTTIAALTAFVETLTEEQSQPVQRFVGEMVFGMIAGGSVLLSEISRPLGSDRWEERELQEAYLELVSPQVRPDTVLALDMGDLTKAYAQAMEGLCQWARDLDDRSGGRPGGPAAALGAETPARAGTVALQRPQLWGPPG